MTVLTFGPLYRYKSGGLGRTNATGRKMDKFQLLMWKNWKLQVRHPLQSIFEILIPVLLCSLVVLIKNLLEVTHHEESIFTPYPVHNATTLSRYNEIVFSPNTSEVKKIMEGVSNDFPKMNYQGFETEHKMERYLVSANSVSKVGVVLDDGLKDGVLLPNNVNITIRFPSELHKLNPVMIANWQTNMLYSMLKLAGPRDPKNNFNAQPEYYEEGFITLQHSISRSVLKYMKDDVEYPTISMQRYPYPAYDQDILLQELQALFGMFFVLGFLYNVSNITKFVTVEKERQLKECMKIMGLPNWLHWAAWFAKSISFLLIAIAIITILYKINFGSNDQGAVFPRTDISLLFIFLLLYVCAITMFGFLLSSLFTSANIATSLASLAFFLSFMPYTILSRYNNTTPLRSKLLASLSMNTAMAYGFQTICVLESAGEGLRWSNIWHNVTPDENLVMGHILFMLLIDSSVYLLLALYIEAVFPGKYGVPKKWNFIFTWCRCWKKKVGDTNPIANVTHDVDTYEPEPTYLRAGIQIAHLKKVYNGNRVAVDDVSLSMFENQITVLLGHNGAGKTTTISMITGLFPPTSGRAIINGYDVETETNKVRSSLGFCPQYNVLFDELTVAEHIYFFSRLKGVSGSELKAEIDYYINLLKLEPKRNVRSAALSGGMKRKLSVAMAFCGKSKVVLLDEPTSGMDPAARRALWDVVESEKLGRTVLLSTHFMDEADILGDRIAIMARGKLQCCGSSFFLKKKYGSGYLLIIEKTADCDVSKVTKMLSNHIADVQLRSNIGSELTYQLQETDRPAFYSIFSNIEANASTMGIVSYGVSLTTLEDVFLKVGSDTITEDAKDKDTPTIRFRVDTPTQLLSGRRLIWNQIQAMLLKRTLTTARGCVFLLLQILIPILILVLAILPSRTGNKSRELPKLKIDLKTYGAPITVLCSNDSSNIYYQGARYLLENEHLPIDDLGSKDVGTYMLNLTQSNPSKSKLRYVIGACYKENETLAWVNNIPLHTLPLALNFMMNSIIKSFDKTKGITVYNHPTPYTLQAKLKLLKQVDMDMGYALGVNIAFSFVFIAGFYVMFYVKERASKAKHLQMVSGVNTFIFWGVSYIWDWIQWLLVCVIIILVLLCFKEDGFKTSSDISRIFVILLYSIFALLPVIYFLSFKYNTPAQGYVRATMILSLGVVFFIVYQILAIESFDLKNVADIVDWPFLFSPLYSMASGIRWTYREYTRLAYCANLLDICKEMGASEIFCKSNICKVIAPCCQPENYYQWERPGILRNIIISLLSGLLLIVMLMIKEYKLAVRCKYMLQKSDPVKEPVESIDNDVEEENAKVRTMSNAEISQHSLVLRNVSKYYPKGFLAVDRLCLSVNAYECFGLLGVNGAGKTTTFKMITGDTSISYGDIFVKGLNMKKDSKKINTQTGYCPQFDALFDELTVKETMRIFCLLRGYQGKDILNVSAKLARTFDLIKHMDKKVMNLSGGNKRKLSTAISMIGDPPIIFLDEPTTGMDPATKRHLWNALCDVRDSGKCLVLTSHSMEECEALCTRLVIMVEGRFKCIGSLQHLKSKFSQGYTLTIKLKKLDEVDAQTADIETAILQIFPDAVLKEQHHELINFSLPGNAVPLSTMFKNMESAKDALDIEDYSISQCGLEEVFLSFTKQDAPEEV